MLRTDTGSHMVNAHFHSHFAYMKLVQMNRCYSTDLKLCNYEVSAL